MFLCREGFQEKEKMLGGFYLITTATLSTYQSVSKTLSKFVFILMAKTQI